jgi:hypothetical protein
MKTTTKALLIGLLVAGAGPALANPTTTSAAASPINVLSATVTTGDASFSGLGTGSMRTQDGNSQAVNVGLTTNLSAATSAESTPDYASSGAVSAVVGADANFTQTFGITSKVGTNSSTATTGATTTTSTTGAVNELISGNFVGSFDTSSDSTTGASTSDVDLAGVSSKSVLNLASSSITLETGARAVDQTDAGNGSGSASGNIASGTTAAAAVTTSNFESGFIQTFSPGTAALAGVETIVPPAQ